jgi:hypothetical protein
MTMSAGREMCMTLAWSMVTDRLSAAAGPHPVTRASISKTGRIAPDLDVIGIDKAPNMAEILDQE